MFCGNTTFQCCTQHNNGNNNGNRNSQFLENSYQSLSPTEKATVVRDIYGKEEPQEETEEFIDEKLENLDYELNRLSKKIRSAYDQAIVMASEQGADSEEYITSRKFRLMFLRADRYDAQLAARRLTMHFKEKLALYGAEKLAVRIKESDLNEDDKAALYSGIYSCTGATDDSGRLLSFIHRHIRVFDQDINLINLKRAVFYLVQNTMEDNEMAQRRGVVGIAYNLGPWGIRQSAKLRKTMPLVRMMFRALPFRHAGLHNCYNDQFYHMFLNFILVVLPKDARIRYQTHYGSHEEVMVQLLSYGIEPDSLPFTSDYGLKQDMINKYLEYLDQKIQSKEKNETSL